MEQILKNKKIGTSKTFSISRNAKKIFENDEIFEHGIDEIPAPTMIKPETSGNKKQAPILMEKDEKSNDQKQTFSDFILNDRNFYNQRRILLQQEKFQKQATNSNLNLNTKGLLGEEENLIEKIGDEIIKSKMKGTLKEINVTKWPQCNKQPEGECTDKLILSIFR